MTGKVRTLRRASLATLALVAMFPTASGARGEAEHVPKPGYSCRVGEPFNAEIWGSSTLDAQGIQVSANLEWRGAAVPGHYDQPQFHGLWSVDGPEPLALADGSAFITWQPRYTAPARQPTKAWLELTTVPRDIRWPAPPFSSSDKAERTPRIETPWGDLITFARGTDRLAMVVRDKRWRIVAQTPVDPALFTGAERRLKATLDRLAAMAADFRSKCEYVEDLDADYDVILI